MPSQTERRVQRAVAAVVMLALIREWNIRRHEPSLAAWPRADRSAAVAGR